MNIQKDIIGDEEEIYERVQSVLGVPKILLDSKDVISPEYKLKAENYIKKNLKSIYEQLEEKDRAFVEIAYIYYLTYLISKTMPIRLPKTMKNISTETTLQTIDWNQFGEEMLTNCDELLAQLQEDYGVETTIGYTMVDLSDVASYPNELA